MVKPSELVSRKWKTAWAKPGGGLLKPAMKIGGLRMRWKRICRKMREKKRKPASGKAVGRGRPLGGASGG